MARLRRQNSPAAGWRSSRTPPTRRAPSSRPRRALSRYSTPSASSTAPTSLRSMRRCVEAIRRHGDPQRLPHLDRTDRHDLAARRQRVERRRAGVRLSLHAPPAGQGRHGAGAYGRGLRARPVPPPVRCRCGAARDVRARRRPFSGRASRHAGGAAAACRQRHLQDHQLPRGHLLRGVQGCLSRGLRPGAQRVAPPTGPTP